MTANYTRTGPFTNGSSPGISASFLNALEQLFAQVSGSTLVGKYFIESGGYQNGWNVPYYQSTYLSNGSTPVSVSIDTADQSPTSGANSPGTSNLTAHGFFISYTVQTLTNTSRCGGNWTLQY